MNRSSGRAGTAARSSAASELLPPRSDRAARYVEDSPREWDAQQHAAAGGLELLLLPVPTRAALATGSPVVGAQLRALSQHLPYALQQIAAEVAERTLKSALLMAPLHTVVADASQAEGRLQEAVETCRSLLAPPENAIPAGLPDGEAVADAAGPSGRCTDRCRQGRSRCRGTCSRTARPAGAARAHRGRDRPDGQRTARLGRPRDPRPRPLIRTTVRRAGARRGLGVAHGSARAGDRQVRADRVGRCVRTGEVLSRFLHGAVPVGGPQGALRRHAVNVPGRRGRSCVRYGVGGFPLEIQPGRNNGGMAA